jgi:hypothetical protein
MLMVVMQYALMREAVVQLAVMQEAVIIESLSDGRYAGGYDLVG